MHNHPHYLIKVWGSLMWKDWVMQELVWAIETESEQRRIIVTTGSKDLSNVVRRYIAGILPDPIDEATHIDITMQSRDIVARAFTHASSKFTAVDSVGWVHTAISQGRVPVLLQYDLLKSLQPFPITRGLSTDTTSAYFSDLLKVGKFIKLTDVDGIYEKLGQGSPYSTISTAELRNKWQTCVDVTLPDLLDKVKMRCYVMSGKNIWNLKKFLQYWTGIHTCIEPQ